MTSEIKIVFDHFCHAHCPVDGTDRMKGLMHKEKKCKQVSLMLKTLLKHSLSRNVCFGWMEAVLWSFSRHNQKTVFISFPINKIFFDLILNVPLGLHLARSAVFSHSLRVYISSLWLQEVIYHSHKHAAHLRLCLDSSVIILLTVSVSMFLSVHVGPQWIYFNYWLWHESFCI